MPHYEGGSPRVFRAMVESMDAAVGRVLKALDAAGRTGDTNGPAASHDAVRNSGRG
jgi:hypothetical protein